MTSENGMADVRSLVDEHYQLVYRYAYRLGGSATLAEDLTQETFCTAQQKIDQLRDPRNARGWLCTILRNHFLHMCRHESIVWMTSLDALPGEPEQPADNCQSVDFDSEQLQRVLGELPEQFRTPVILFYFEEFSYRQIAQQMSVPIGTVMSRLARAKAYLRSRLTSNNAIRHTTTTRGVI